MVNITGNRKNKTQIKRKADRVVKYLGIDMPVTIRFMDYDSPDKYGFAAEIMGSHYVCIFNDCPDTELGKVISHELVHVWQNVRGDLSFDYNNMIFTWKGEKYDQARLDSMEYYDRPWEEEAKKLENKLAQDFFMS